MFVNTYIGLGLLGLAVMVKVCFLPRVVKVRVRVVRVRVRITEIRNETRG